MNLSPDNRVIPDPNFPSQEPRMTEDLCIITQSLQENQDPHSSKALTLEEEENPDTQILPNPDTENPPPPLDQPVEEQMQDDLDEGANFSPLATYSRRGGTGGGPKRKKLNQKRRAAHEKKLQQKLEILVENINPIPFVPIKTLDFSSHEELLRRLGLWDFVHLEFDRSIRSDLVVQLIANYSASSRSSYVNGVRIMVNRADLARALRLPVRKEKAGTVPENAPVFDETEESVTFIEGLVSNWMLLHEDMWMMPTEMMNWTKLIKDGHFEKVDWATLMWFMLEKELLAAPKLGDCYYASHMQCLIKCQRVALLREEEPKMEIDTKEDEDCSGDLKVADDTRGPEIEERDIELSLGQDNTLKEEESSKEHVGIDVVMREKEDDVNEEPMDIGETKGEECGQWVVDGKSNVGTRGLFLRRCNLGDVGNVGGMCEESKGGEGEGEGEEEEDGHGEEDGHEEVQDMGFHLSPKGDPLETVTSANLIATMEAMQSEPFSSGLQLPDDNGPSGEFLVSKVSTHLVPGSSMLFGNGSNKRVIEQENDMSHQLNDSNKRLRTGGPWDTDSDDFDTCMEQIQEWTGKARMMYLAKERDCDSMNVNQQYLVSEMQQRDNLIEYLRKAQHEEQQKKRVEVYRLERELYTMGNILEGYRKALKETHKSFSEYRARCPIPEEPLYKDAGSGGLVLTKWELEKLRMEQEEEERRNQLLSLIQQMKDFDAVWSAKFDLHIQEIGFLDNRLQEAEKKVRHVQEASTERKLSDRMESDANEGRIVSEMVESDANEGRIVSEMVESVANEGASVSEMAESGANEAGSDE